VLSELGGVASLTAHVDLTLTYGIPRVRGWQLFSNDDLLLVLGRRILRSVGLAQSIKCSNDKSLRVLSDEIIVFIMDFAVV
jgi:hypothetical protein